MKSIKDQMPDLNKFKSKEGNNSNKKEEKQLPISADLLDRDLIARNEINLEKWSSFIFPHARTKGLEKPRVMTYEVEAEEGSTKGKTLSVLPISGSKAYTAKTYTTLLSLIIWWHKHPTSDGSFKLHFSDLAKIKGISHRSGKNIKGLQDDLLSLSRTVMSWNDSFIDDNGIFTDLDDLHILDRFHIKSEGKSYNKRYIHGRFHGSIVRNFLAGKTNPKNLTSIMKIRSEIAQIIFRHIDTKTYKKIKLEKNSRALFDELGLVKDNKKYRYLSERKLLLERVIKEIDKLILSTGNILRIKLETSDNGRDIKIVCHNIPANYLPSNTGKLKPIHSTKTDINELSNIMFEAVKMDDENFISWTKTLAKYYDKDIIFKVVGDFKEMDRHSDFDMESRGKVFTNYFHKTAHQRGKEWIGKSCNEDCPLRPENQKQGDLL